jgi:hypothetical protein
MEHQLDATITVLLISKFSSTCFGQTFAHLQERKTEIFFHNMWYNVLLIWQAGVLSSAQNPCLHRVGVLYYFTWKKKAWMNNKILQIVHNQKRNDKKIL